MNKIWISLLIVPLFVFGACDLISGLEDAELTEEEIVEGLKTALNVGTDTSVTVLNATDGYYKDEIVKVLLPPEGEVLYEVIEQIEDILGQDYLENTVMRINRAAEDAASEAKPIFVGAVRDMTIQDGLNILQGVSPTGEKVDFDSTAATAYLRLKTYDQLVVAYAPKIDNSLDQDLIGNTSANDAWDECTAIYNALVFPDDGITVSLGEHTTTKALDGVFYKIGLEEKKIRKDPYAWALDILNKVFGSVYQE